MHCLDATQLHFYAKIIVVKMLVSGKQLTKFGDVQMQMFDVLAEAHFIHCSRQWITFIGQHDDSPV